MLLVFVSVVIGPGRAFASLPIGVGSVYIGGSNKSQGFLGCQMPIYRADGYKSYTYQFLNGAPLQTMGIGSFDNLGQGHYSAGLENCTNGTVSMMGIWRNATQTALDAYGTNQNGYWTSYVPGLVKNYYNQTSSVFVKNVGASTQVPFIISLYDASGAVVYETSDQLGLQALKQYDLKDITTIPNGRYSARIATTVENLIATTVVTRNESGPDRVIAWKGVPYGSTQLYAPSFRKNYYGYYSTLILTNTTNSVADLEVKIVGAGITVFIDNLGSYATHTINSNNMSGLPDGDYTVVIDSDQNVVGMSSTFHSTNNARGAYALPQANWDSSRYRALPALWNVTPASSPRVTSVKCMDTSGNIPSLFRLHVQGGVNAESPITYEPYSGYEFSLQNIPQFPQHTMFAALAENNYGRNIACIASSTVSGATDDKFFQYESNYSNNDTNQANSSKFLGLYDDQ